MKRKIILAMMYLCVQFLSFAQPQKKSDFNFMDFIVNKEFMFKNSSCFLDVEQHISISYIICFLDLSPLQQGMGSLFAIPKQEFSIWQKEYPFVGTKKELFANSKKKNDITKELLFLKRDTLIEKFDLYVFYVKPNDIFVDHQIPDDNGKLQNEYDFYPNANIHIYTYKNGQWIEIEEIELKDDIPRTYGERYVKEILKERFGKDISDQTTDNQ